MKKIVITIARQYGSGGREIGERLAALLNIPLYDKELITAAANKGNLDEDAIMHTDETCAGSLLYTLAIGSNAANSLMRFGYHMPLNDKLFLLQSEVIKEYASEGSCIIIGRCADYVLRDEKDVFRVFIYGDTEHRRQRVLARHPEIKPSSVLDVIAKTDKRRSSYYNFYTGKKWGKYDNYDIALNSSTLGIEGTAELLFAAISSLINDEG